MTDLPPRLVTVETEGLSLSVIVWRAARGPHPGLIERVLELNPGLAAKGPILPVGTVIRIPVERPEAPRPVEPITLWT